MLEVAYCTCIMASMVTSVEFERRAELLHLAYSMDLGMFLIFLFELETSRFYRMRNLRCFVSLLHRQLSLLLLIQGKKPRLRGGWNSVMLDMENP